MLDWISIVATLDAEEVGLFGFGVDAGLFERHHFGGELLFLDVVSRLVDGACKALAENGGRCLKHYLNSRRQGHPVKSPL
jgi:hypothetical protein